MSDSKSLSECLKSRVIELGITRRVKDGRMVTVLLENKSERPRSRESSGSNASLRSAPPTGMTRFEAAREAARAWSGHKELSRRGYSSPASQDSARSTRSAPALIHRKVLSPLKFHRRNTSRGGPSKKWLEDHEETMSSTISDSEQSSSGTDQTLSRSRRSKPRKDHSRRQASHSRHHVDHHEDRGETQGPSTLVDNEASGHISRQGTEKATKTSQDLGLPARGTTGIYSNPGPNTPHPTFPGFTHQQTHYHHPLEAFAAQHTNMGPGATQDFLGTSGQGTTNGYHVYYVPRSYPYQIPLFSPSAVIPQSFGSNQMTNPQVQTVTASQAAQAAALTVTPSGNNEPGRSKDGTTGGQAPQYQTPRVVVYTAASSGDSTATRLVSPTYSVDTSQPSGLEEASTATTNSTMAVSTENNFNGQPNRNGELDRISLDSQAVPRPDSMRSEASTNSKATSRAHGRLLGPLSKHYFCFGCGRVRSKRFHRQNPLKDNRDPDTNYCANCRREHAKKAAVHDSVSLLSSVYPEVVMPESSSIGSTSHLSHSSKYQSLRQSSAGLLPDTPTRKPTSREGGKLLCDSPAQNRLISSPRKPTSRLTTPPRRALPRSSSAKANSNLRNDHSQAYRPPSVESVIDSSLEYSNEAPRVAKHRSKARVFSAKKVGATETGAVPGISCLQHPNEPRTAPLSNDPKQVRFDQRLEEWFNQSSQAHVDGSEESQDWTVQPDHDKVENNEDAVGGVSSSNSSPTVLGESQISGVKVPNENMLFREPVNEDEGEEEEDEVDDDDDPFAIPARSHKPKLFPVTIRMVTDESAVSTRQESVSPTPVPRFRSISDRGSPVRNFSEKLVATKHAPVALRPQSPLASRQTRGEEASTVGSHYLDAPRQLQSLPQSFQFRTSGPHNYSPVHPTPASAPLTRKAFDFSSLADDYRDESDPFYSHSLSDWELEQRFQELHQASSWAGCDTQDGLGVFAEYEEGGSDMLDEEGTDCDYGPLHPDDGYFSME
ncbi:hypothetical protein MCOR25_005386 [Pyricularia grisea]|nr:hypothetical protein MCOR25_005386 [Pyricularia grisea]